MSKHGLCLWIIMGLPACQSKNNSVRDANSDAADANTILISGQLMVGEGIDTVLAFPISPTGKVDSAQAELAKESIVTNGTLAITLDLGTSLKLQDDDSEENSASGHLVMVYDSEAGDRFEQAETVELISMPVASEGLLAIPTQDLTEKTLELGEITQQDDGLTSSIAATEGQFSTNKDQLSAMSKIDNALRVAKNSFMNHNPFKRSRLDADVSFVLSEVWGNELLGQFASPSHDLTTGQGKPEYVGYGFSIQGFHQALDLDQICGESRKALEFIPPGGATGTSLLSIVNENDLEGANQKKLAKFRTTNETNYTVTENPRWDNSPGCTHTATVTYDSSTYTVGVTDLSKFSETSDGLDMLNLGFAGNDLIFGSIPKGLWDLKFDGSTIAKFDLGVADPVSSLSVAGKNYRYPGYFVPVLRAELNPDKSIKTIKLRYYLYNFNSSNPQQSEFTVVTNPKILSQVINFISVEMYGTKKGSSGSDKTAYVGINNVAEFLETMDADGTLSFQDPDFGKFYLLTANEADPADSNTDKEDGPYLLNLMGTGYSMFGVGYVLRGKVDCSHHTTAGPWKCQF